MAGWLQLAGEPQVVRQPWEALQPQMALQPWMGLLPWVAPWQQAARQLRRPQELWGAWFAVPIWLQVSYPKPWKPQRPRPQQGCLSGPRSPQVPSGQPEYQPLLGYPQQLPVTCSYNAACAPESPRPPPGQLSYIRQQGGSHCTGLPGGEVLQQVGRWMPPQEQACQVAPAYPEAG